MRVDFHSHILPAIDDGAKDVNESVSLLKRLADDKVDKVVLTSHFYRQNEKISAFIEKRDRAFDILSEAAKGIDNCPKLIKGAEVYFYPSLSSDPDFGKLCIEGTDYLLLEMPFELFKDNLYREYANFMNKCRQKIIFAHIERYLNFGNTVKEIDKLFDYGNAVCQMNCSSLAGAGFFKRKKLLELINGGYISVIGTDTHNTDTRPPRFGEAERVIVSKCGKDAFDAICRNSDRILDNCRLSELE